MTSEQRRARRVTLLDVAREAEVSRATASLVIRKSPLVADETRRRVEAAMDRLGYVYNMGAAGMRAARSNTVGVIVPNLANPFFAEMLAGIEQALEGAGMVVVLANSREAPANQETILRRMRERGVDGVILCPVAGTRPALLGKAAGWKLPVVQALRHVSESECDYAGVDYAGGMRQAVEHLRALGHRSIAFGTGGPVHSAYRERLAGFCAAMEARGLDPGVTIELPVAPPFPPEAARRLIDHPARPTAAICFSDVMAACLANSFADAGVAVGAGFSIVGFDDLAVAEMARPRLTSVATFPGEVGEAAARLLLSRLESPERGDRRLISLTRLVARDSTAAAPARD
ncbi:LacI family DNA-binding transcriptional regulator [Amaricoccus solimangrovi]|uniref:Substrate-binding domain-containing protein n=1 Tax=Amaricoccus solimangrovi TaxID=2589815 RepID=A0A501WUK6_9RHOB|nr:LacI family DNA-binding transcriptional regulator [Amaricoccus solimangrovi]TPE49536.1 substrate-binding domain-containing protein [Amaricoccus solimangrovi]